MHICVGISEFALQGSQVEHIRPLSCPLSPAVVSDIVKTCIKSTFDLSTFDFNLPPTPFAAAILQRFLPDRKNVAEWQLLRWLWDATGAKRPMVLDAIRFKQLKVLPAPAASAKPEDEATAAVRTVENARRAERRWQLLRKCLLLFAICECVPCVRFVWMYSDVSVIPAGPGRVLPPVPAPTKAKKESKKPKEFGQSFKSVSVPSALLSETKPGYEPEELRFVENNLYFTFEVAAHTQNVTGRCCCCSKTRHRHPKHWQHLSVHFFQ